MDKTGTLTENQLDLVFRKNLSKESTMRFNSLIAFYCQSTLEKNKTIKALEKQFRDSGAELNDSVIADEMPFNSAIKQSGLEINNAGKHIRLILGGCESLYPRLENSADTKSIKELNESQASLGYRNLLLIYKESQAEKFDSALGDENDKSYKPLGFFSLEDKMRSNAEEIIASFIKSGVRPVVISGDNQHTLLSLIDKLHIKELQKVISCEQLKTQEEIDDAVIHYNVFARVTPQQKLQIIKTLKNQHRYVGMIGDGVNDALAIKEANIGIALGSGADATKSIADIILLDDKLINLNEIIQEGRRVLYNSRRGLQLILTKNFYAMILIVMTLFLGLPFPFHTRGLFILSLFIASLSSLFILLDRGKAPREVFGVKLYSFVITSAISIGVIGLVILIFSRNIVHLKTLLLTFLILTGQINYLFSLNKENVSLKKIFNFRAKKSWLVIFWIVAYLIFMYVPAIANTFTLKPLTLAHWLFILSAVFAYVVVFEIAYPPLVKFLTKHLNP
jgi:cation-transporting ATPase E